MYLLLNLPNLNCQQGGDAGIPKDKTEESNEGEMKKFGNEPLQLILGRKKYHLVEDNDDGQDMLKKDPVDEILKVPQMKVSCMVGIHMQGLPRCISNKKYQEIIQAKEDQKRKRRN